MNLIDLKERIAISDAFTPEERTFLLTAINAAPPMEKYEAPNYLGRIEQIWAFLSLDEGGEGVCAAPMGELTMPLIAADKRRLDDLFPLARGIANVFGKPVRLAKFSQREDVTIIQPRQTP
jgi:hypothetical protein